MKFQYFLAVLTVSSVASADVYQYPQQHQQQPPPGYGQQYQDDQQIPPGGGNGCIGGDCSQIPFPGGGSGNPNGIIVNGHGNTVIVQVSRDGFARQVVLPQNGGVPNFQPLPAWDPNCDNFQGMPLYRTIPSNGYTYYYYRPQMNPGYAVTPGNIPQQYYNGPQYPAPVYGNQYPSQYGYANQQPYGYGYQRGSRYRLR